MSTNKRSKKFLSLAKKGGGIGAMKKGRKRRRSVEADDDMEDVELEKAINLQQPVDIPQVEEAKKSKKGAINRHRDQLESLKDADPDFYKFLQKNDNQILEFGDGEEEGDEEFMDEADNFESGNAVEDDDENDESHGSEDEDGENTAIETPETIEVTSELIRETVEAATGGSAISIKMMLAILRSACIPHGDDADDDDDGEQSRRPSFTRFKINTADVYNEVIVSVLENAHVAFFALLGIDGAIPSKAVDAIMEHSKWKKMQLYILSFYKSVLHTLAGLAVGSRDGNVSAYLINCLEDYVVFLARMPRLAKGVLKVLLNLWSEGPASWEGAVNVRGYAFLRIRQMALLLPGAMAEECLRSLYLTYARLCKNYTEMNAQSIAFMAESIETLYSADVAQAYQQSFLYVRQLALHLRAAILKKSSEAIKQLATWQFLNCVRLWTKVICAMPGQQELGALAFPLAQIIFGIMASSPSIYSLPFKFHLMTCLHQLAAACQLFIPTAAKLCETLEHADLYSKQTPSTEVAPRLAFLVKFAPDSVTRAVVRDLIVKETIALLQHDSEIYRFHVGFPEYSYLTTRKLRAFAKKAKVSMWRDLARTLASQLDSYAASAKQGRVALGKSPMQVTEFEPLLPSTTPIASVRLAKLLSGRGLQQIGTVGTGTAAKKLQKKDQSGNGDSLSAKKEGKVGGDGASSTQPFGMTAIAGDKKTGKKAKKAKRTGVETDGEKSYEPLPVKKGVDGRDRSIPQSSEKTKKANKGGVTVPSEQGQDVEEDEVHAFSWSDDEDD